MIKSFNKSVQRVTEKFAMRGELEGYQDLHFSKKRRSSQEIGKNKNERPLIDSTSSSSWRVENIRKSGPATELDWWTDDDDAKRFRNCGLSTWEESRRRWRTQTVANLPSPPPPVNCDDVITGLTQV